MKRIIAYILLLLGVAVVPVEKQDVAKLRPIEVIYICNRNGAILLQTDTDDLGVGMDTQSALENMKQTSPAVIYLDTARYLLIGPGGEEPAQQLQGILKDNVRICKTEESIPLTDVATYLPVHENLPRFSCWLEGEKLPVLTLENGRIKIS